MSDWPAGGGRRPNVVYDGKRPRQITTRQTYDFNSSIVNYLMQRNFMHNYNDIPFLLPNLDYIKEILPMHATRHNTATGLCTKYIQTIKNKVATVINCIRWNPEGRRLVTGCHSGEFALWNGFTFNFETITQCHDKAVRAMEWTHTGRWLISGDDLGIVKYWEPSLNRVVDFQPHSTAIRGIALAPSDLKFTTAGENILSLIDFETHTVEGILEGHGQEIRTVDWHPSMGMVVSGGKDRTMRVWDPRSGTEVACLHAHNNTIAKLQFNQNGMWLASGSKDTSVKLWDIRTMREFRTLRGHRKDVTALRWHTVHEQQLTTASSDGNILHWNTMLDLPQAEIAQAHDVAVWDLDWHPMGHILLSASNDQSARFWAQNLPGDEMADRHNVGQLPTQERKDALRRLTAALMVNQEQEKDREEEDTESETVIPGLSGARANVDRELVRSMLGMREEEKNKFPSTSSTSSGEDRLKSEIEPAKGSRWERDRDYRANRESDSSLSSSSSGSLYGASPAPPAPYAASASSYAASAPPPRAPAPPSSGYAPPRPPGQGPPHPGIAAPPKIPASGYRSGGYGAPPAPSGYGAAPPTSGYGAVPTASQFGALPTSGYGAQGGYGAAAAAPASDYGAAPSGYGAPPRPAAPAAPAAGYGAAAGYGPPAPRPAAPAGGYGSAPAGGYGAAAGGPPRPPAPSGYGSGSAPGAAPGGYGSGASGYGAPAPGGYGSTAPSGYGAVPGGQGYGQAGGPPHAPPQGPPRPLPGANPAGGPPRPPPRGPPSQQGYGR